MSGSIQPLNATPRSVSGAAVVVNGITSTAADATQIQAEQTPGTHVGIPNADLTLPLPNTGQIVSLYTGRPFIADPALYAWIMASPIAANITWAD